MTSPDGRGILFFFSLKKKRYSRQRDQSSCKNRMLCSKLFLINKKGILKVNREGLRKKL
ncbi:hypothetical protein FEM08_05060 [Flavobacterium gilvum]|nr:hypothetical protein FEM08_05060 [Flavobacterium gilvum]